ncbi:hypothetical protein M407DRAFT_53066, partial [Tulasnella calospora MUT 4182]
KPVEERKSIRQLAREHDIDHSVLSRLVKGQPTMGEFNTGKQLFTPAEELTVQFVNRFLQRHPCLSIYRAAPLDRNCASGMNPTAVKDYLDMVEELFTTHNLPGENILGMDEVGVNTGIFAHQLTIAGNGTMLRPTVIFKGKYRMSSWSEDNPDQANVTVSARGYTENVISLEYIKDFDDQTSHLEGPCFLFVDGHQSHCTIDFLEYAVAHNIIVISYPLHTMHELQGLDVACFGALKIYWTQECERYWRSTGKRVNNDTFLCVYSRARARAFTPETIRSAFWTTGLIPHRHDFCHHNFLCPDAMAPALETSVKGGFPLPLPSPVHAIQAAIERLPSEPSENEREDAMDEVEVDLAEVLRSTSTSFLITDSPLKSTSRLAAPVIQSVPASLRPGYSILHAGPAN